MASHTWAMYQINRASTFARVSMGMACLRSFSAKAIAQVVLLGAKAEDVDLPLPYRTTSVRWVQRKEHISTQAWRAVVERQIVDAKL